jgi:hypothetical protein
MSIVFEMSYGAFSFFLKNATALFGAPKKHES